MFLSSPQSAYGTFLRFHVQCQPIHSGTLQFSFSPYLQLRDYQVILEQRYSDFAKIIMKKGQKFIFLKKVTKNSWPHLGNLASFSPHLLSTYILRALESLWFNTDSAVKDPPARRRMRELSVCLMWWPLVSCQGEQRKAPRTRRDREFQRKLETRRLNHILKNH